MKKAKEQIFIFERVLLPIFHDISSFHLLAKDVNFKIVILLPVL